MAKNEKTGSKTAALAGKGLSKPSSLTNKQVRKVAGAALTQAPDRGKSKKR